jgi:hypothetical protein
MGVGVEADKVMEEWTRTRVDDEKEEVVRNMVKMR